jgi:hypothetical protein
MRKRPRPRIAIRGQYLDEVRIRCAERHPYPVSYLTFPVHRHWARVGGEPVTVCAAAVVQLFADGILPAVGGGDVVIEVDGDKIGPCLLEAVESGEQKALDVIIVLRFQSLADART